MSKKPFKGVIKLDVRDSKPDWEPYTPTKAPEGAPNILFVLYDDTGLAAWSPFGGGINMPTLQKLADNGLKYSQWHTTALCSPTRSTLLTGRNHHVNGMAAITEASSGFPGQHGRLPDTCATIGQILQDGGWSTFWIGKNHNVPEQDVASGASRKQWPLQQGFDRFYGFLGGETNQWYPDLTEDNRFIDQPYAPEEGYHLSKDLADQAIGMIRDQKASNPSKPWYLWFCPGANHAPHHAPKDYIAKYKGKFDDGYEAYRAWVLPRMIERGIVPKDTKLTEINPMPADMANPADAVRPWNSLNADEKKLFSSLMEVYAAFSEYTDAQIGRILDYLEQSGQLENTIVLYAADNGASGEGTPNGSVNENKFFNGYPDELSENLKLIDVLGGPDTYEHFPTGWAVATSTPFKMFKRYSEYAGGTCDPLVISWPKGIKARGEVRNQYHHSTDIVPTLLELCGLEMPKVYKGVEQAPIAGVSMRYTFDAKPDAPTQKKRQYYAMLGSRGIWENGWKACAVHAPLSGKGHFDKDRWELYHVDVDRAESKDLAKEHPEKLETLIQAWVEEADKNMVLPLDDRSALEVLGQERPSEEAARDRYVYYPGTSPVPEGVAVNVRGRSFKILADVEIEGADFSGVIFAHGSRFGGHSLFLKDKKLHYVYNFLGIKPEQKFVSPELKPGKYTLGMEYIRESEGEHKESIGKTKLYVSDKVVAEGPMRTQPGKFTLSGDGLCIGRDSGDAVSAEYKSPGEFKGGTILFVGVTVEKAQYLDLETLAAGAFAAELADGRDVQGAAKLAAPWIVFWGNARGLATAAGVQDDRKVVKRRGAEHPRDPRWNESRCYTSRTLNSVPPSPLAGTPVPKRSPLVPILGTVGFVITAVLVRLALTPVLQGTGAYNFFYLAILACAWFFGARSATAASILSGLIAYQFFIPRDNPLKLISLLPFALSSIGMVLMARGARQIRSREERANAYLANLVYSTDDAVVSKDLNGIIRSCNPACERMFGYEAKELVGKPITMLIPTERHSEEVEILSKLRMGESIDHFETVRVRKDGRQIHVSLTISPVFGPDGTIIGVSKIARDITRQRLAEAGIAQQREWLKRTLESIGDAVIATDVHCNVEFMNPIAEHLTGWRAAEAQGKSCEDVFHIVNERTRQAVENPVKRVLDQGAAQGLANHTLLIARDGTEHPIDDSAGPIRNSEGRIVGVVLVFRDVTERRAAENERQAAASDRERLLEAERVARAESERANRVKDDFMAMVSHELRTPLNAILGWTNLLLEGAKDAEQRRGLEVIQRNTRVQAQLISDLLDISRIVSGKLLLDVQRVNLVTIIENSIDTVQHAADAKGITIHRRLDTAVGDTVGDPSRLQQAVWNLLTNAIKFTGKDGRIDVEMHRVESRIEISVSDNGIGIRPELLGQVFERFHQQDAPTTRQYGGLGLGLSIVRHLVELHGGSVRAMSVGEGKGATFTISLPISVSRPPDGPGLAGDRGGRDAMRPSDRHTLKGIRVLVVEDEEDSRNVICRLLEAHGAEVASASSASDAIEQVKRKPPQIFVSDIGLPGVDGYDFIRQVRALGVDGIESIPAVALTAFARSEDRTRALLAGYQVHIAKPVEPAELVATLASFAELIRSREN